MKTGRTLFVDLVVVVATVAFAGVAMAGRGEGVDASELAALFARSNSALQAEYADEPVAAGSNGGVAELIPRAILAEFADEPGTAGPDEVAVGETCGVC